MPKEITNEDLFASFKKGQRNGNWRKRNRLDRVLYIVSLWYTKRFGGIVNETLVEKLLGLVERLEETKGMGLFRRIFKKAVELLDKSEEEVFTWAPQLKEWLKNSDYIFWLGTAR